MKRKTILVDLDGVLNEYNGKFDIDFIPPIRSGAKEFLAELSSNFNTKIFTTRPLKQTQKWIDTNKLNTYISGITNKKEPAYLIIDDRCINFDGNYKKTIERINNFQVWYNN